MINSLSETIAKIHFEHPLAVAHFQAALNALLIEATVEHHDLVFVCIGTDRSTGDSLGPLCGSHLIDSGAEKNPRVFVYGTLDKPVHAMNLSQTIETIKCKHHKPYIIALDACLGSNETLGYINIKKGALRPGSGVNKELPQIGDIHIVGVVNVAGFMEYLVLQNTRLGGVIKMSEIITQGISAALNGINFPSPSPMSPMQAVLH